ncbi:MAG: 50S ribosomal protein L5 [Planctomycetota bacterium]|jgi:large subunit ribosomal protein L5
MKGLLERCSEEIYPAVGEDLGCTNALAIPRLEKVVVSMGVGKGLQEKRRMPAAMDDLARITGQKPAVCKAKKSVSNFKLRKGYEIGCKVTLRGRRMYDFVERLINVAIPRLRDFRGLPPDAFDGKGNYSMGVAEQSVFPEINLDKMEFGQGMNITLVTTADNDTQARRLLTMMGMPFRQQQGQES